MAGPWVSQKLGKQFRRSAIIETRKKCKRFKNSFSVVAAYSAI